MQNNINPFFQIKNFIMKINEHIFQINEIIKMMNNIMNQISIPNQINNLMNQMNNIIPMQNNFNFNNNNKFSLDQNFVKSNDFNIYFKSEIGQKNLVVIQKNKSINELINSYFQHIKLADFIDNYDRSYSFWYNGKNLINFKEKKVKEILQNGCPIEVCKIK